jgi:N-hydroxyarylamine O-acetyltransferase
MTNVNSLFRKRIGLQEDLEITLDMLDELLERTALAIPFENICVIAKNGNSINKENLVDKVLIKNEGGLCYELNTLLYYFLLENGFKVSLARGVVFDHQRQVFGEIGRTHVTILLNDHGRTYIVDTGFGGNLPLRPVPLTGETVSSFNGDFRVQKHESEHGDYVLEMKLKHKDTEWRIGYAFHSERLVGDVNEMNEVQKIITESPLATLNKGLLITRLTSNGNITLTDTSLTKWIDGQTIKEEIKPEQFNELAKQYFQMDIK